MKEETPEARFVAVTPETSDCRGRPELRKGVGFSRPLRQSTVSWEIVGEPGRTRTCNPLIKRPSKEN